MQMNKRYAIEKEREVPMLKSEREKEKERERERYQCKWIRDMPLKKREKYQC